jgi:sodium/potassium-transporting ATPase subunit alpha
MLPLNCRVIRDGSETVIKAETLVAGDVVHLTTGDKVPADIRIFNSNNGKVERSSMTGESEPEPLTVEKSSDKPTESTNLAFSSSLVVDGEAYGVVIKTGDRTMIGQLARATSAKSQKVRKGKLCGLLGGPNDTTLEVEVKRFVFIISLIAFGMAVIFFVIGVAQGQDVLFTFINGFITVIIANVPQGLPATVTSCLAIASQRLAKRNVLVKRLATVETLGAANVICSDKTGTLTENKMTVTNLWFDAGFVPATESFEDGNEVIQHKSFLKLFRIAVLCNRAYFDPSTETEEQYRRRSIEESGFQISRKSGERASRPSIEIGNEGIELEAHHRPTLNNSSRSNQESLRESIELDVGLTEETIDQKTIVGDASETALFRYCNLLSNVKQIKERFPKIFEIPFNSTNKWQLSIHDCSTKNKAKHLLVIKGAPEILLKKCSHAFINNQKVEINEDFIEKYQVAYRKVAGNGERVLGFAQKKYTPEDGIVYTQQDKNFPSEGFTFIGLISLQDPPRKGVYDAIKTCNRAGMKVMMVTGDHPFTAEAIARQVGIIETEMTKADAAKHYNIPEEEVSEDQYGAVVVYGSQINDFEDKDWDRVLSKKEIVFARTSPQNKLEIVKQNQLRGNVVAVTGDGVNDSPALKQADLGVAMGISGSDVAREAAELVLLDDNFASIISAIHEGRVIYDNLKKTIAYTLSHLWPEILPVLLFLAAGMPLGLSSLLVLMIDLGTELFPAISLAYEKPEADVMTRPPRDVKKDHLVSFSLLSYSYLQVGMIEVGLCFISYFLIFYSHGIPASALPRTTDYFKSGAPIFKVSDELEFTEEQQLEIIQQVNAAWFMCVVLCQFFHIWVCKTRIVSVFKHTMKNWLMFVGVGVALALMVLFVYVPGVQTAFGTANPPGWVWAPPAGMLLLVWPLTEIRKYIGRKYPKSKAAKRFVW